MFEILIDGLDTPLYSHLCCSAAAAASRDLPDSLEIHQSRLQFSHRKQRLLVRSARGLSDESVPHLSPQNYRLRSLGMVERESVGDCDGVLQRSSLVCQAQSDLTPQQERVDIRQPRDVLVSRLQQDNIQGGHGQLPLLPLDVELGGQLGERCEVINH